MSEKQTSAEAMDDEQTREASDLFQHDAKSAKLATFFDTELQDLPNELLADILIQAVVAEVRDMHLVKRLWKEKADFVFNRLQTVCLLWKSLLTTNFIQNRVHGILEGTAAEDVLLGIQPLSPIHLFVYKVAMMKDEIFLLWRPGYQESYINVHDRTDMVTVKAVVPLPGMLPVDMAGGSGQSNCLYVLNKEAHSFTVYRITKDDEQRFHMSPWITDPSLSFHGLSLSIIPDAAIFVSVSDCLIVLYSQMKPKRSTVSIYDSDGCLQHAVALCPYMYVHTFSSVFSVIQKSNGNLVLTSDNQFYTGLTEIDTTGRTVRQYCSNWLRGGLSVADSYGRIWMLDRGWMKLFDSELNPMASTNLQQCDGFGGEPCGMFYSSHRNEIVCLCERAPARSKTLTIFSFT